MYIERFWIKNILGDTFFNLNFCNQDQKIRRWSLFQNIDSGYTDRGKTLFFRFLAVCVSGLRYVPQLKKEISKVYGRRNEITGFGAILRSDVYKTKKGEYFYRAKNEYIVLPGGIIEPASEEKFKMSFH